MVSLADTEEVPEEVFANVLIGFHLNGMRIFGYIISPQQRYKCFHFIKGTIFLTLFAVFTSLNLIKLSNGLGNIVDAATCCSITCTLLTTFIATANAYVQRKRVVRMVKFLHEDITELLRITDAEEEQMLNESVKYIRMILGIMYGPTLMAGLICIMDAFYHTITKPESVFNMPQVLNGTIKPILIFQILPFGEVSDNFIVYYCGSIFAVSLTITTLPCWHTFVTALMKYIVLKYDIINKRLKDYDLTKISLNKNYEEFQLLPENELQYWHTKMCGFFIREQAKLRWFTKELECVIKIPVFIDFVIYSVLMCFLFYAIAEGNSSAIDYFFLAMYVSGMLVLMWLYYWHATLVTASNDKLHFALYSSPWYTFPVNIQKNILLMMMESTKPLKMKALFVEMNLQTLVDLIRGAYSYFTILRNSNLE